MSNFFSNGKTANLISANLSAVQSDGNISDYDENIKILVSGPYGSGKTQFIKTLSEIAPLTTEENITLDAKKDEKVTTTVAMDYGKFQFNEQTAVHLFGTPGQKRFDFMREILGIGARGLILLVDARLHEDEQEQAREILTYFESRNFSPIVVCANKQDLSDALDPVEIKKRLGVKDEIAVIPMMATRSESALQAVKIILSADAQKTMH